MCGITVTDGGTVPYTALERLENAELDNDVTLVRLSISMSVIIVEFF